MQQLIQDAMLFFLRLSQKIVALCFHYSHEYPLKVDGVYYHRWTRINILLIHVRGKRTAYHIPIHMILNDKSLIDAMSPIDACIIGILVNNERHGIVESQSNSYRKMRRIKHQHTFDKSESLLKIVRSYMTDTGATIVVLASRFVQKEIQMPVEDLYNNISHEYTTLFNVLPRHFIALQVAIIVSNQINDTLLMYLKVWRWFRPLTYRVIGSSIVGLIVYQLVGTSIAWWGNLAFISQIIPCCQIKSKKMRAYQAQFECHQGVVKAAALLIGIFLPSFFLSVYQINFDHNSENH